MKKIALIVATLAAMAVSVPTIASAQGVELRIGGDRDRGEMRGEMRGDRDRGEMRGDRDRGEMRSRGEFRERDRSFCRERPRDRVVVIKRRYRRDY